MSDWNVFVGKKISNVEASNDLVTISFFASKEMNDFFNEFTITELSNITISYLEHNQKFELYARSECCSVSWFEFPTPIAEIIGKEFKSLYGSNFVDLPNSGRQEYDKNQPWYITFNDDSQFEFYLRNSSNGWYGGWLEASIVDVI